MEFLPEYGLALSSGTVALFRRANGALAAVFAFMMLIKKLLKNMLKQF